MSDTPDATAIIEHSHLMDQLLKLIRCGKGDSAEADIICDTLDESWSRLTAEEKSAARLLLRIFWTQEESRQESLRRWNTHQHTGQCVTRATFPLGVPVVVETMINRESGWEFDAPMEIMSPFRLFREVSSINGIAVYNVLENLLIDLDCKYSIPEQSFLPTEDEVSLRAIFSRVRSGHDRRRWAYFRTTITVHRWWTTTTTRSWRNGRSSHE